MQLILSVLQLTILYQYNIKVILTFQTFLGRLNSLRVSLRANKMVKPHPSPLPPPVQTNSDSPRKRRGRGSNSLQVAASVGNSNIKRTNSSASSSKRHGIVHSNKAVGFNLTGENERRNLAPAFPATAIDNQSYSPESAVCPSGPVGPNAVEPKLLKQMSTGHQATALSSIVSVENNQPRNKREDTVAV